MQPLTPGLDDPQYVPQPVGTGGQKPPLNKRLFMIIGIAVGGVLLLAGAFWLLAKSAKNNYVQAAATYKQEITDVRDGLDKTLEDQGISGNSHQAIPFFEEYGKKLQEVIASEPKPPKVLGIMPVSAGQAKDDTEALTRAASAYANELRRNFELSTYYVTVAEKFKPIKNLGLILAVDEADITALPGLWQTFLADLRAMHVPADLEATHAQLIQKGEALHTGFKTVADTYKTSTIGQIDQALSNLTTPSKEFNDIFNKSASDMSKSSLRAIADAYSALKAILK